MKSVKTTDMRKVTGGCHVEVCKGCGKKFLIIGPISLLCFVSHTGYTDSCK